MEFAANIKSKCDYFGKLVIKDDRIEFQTHILNSDGSRRRKYFIEYGDVVYFMFKDEKLLKIGKAGGVTGWYGRQQEYTKPMKHWDRTTKKIYAYLKENKIDEIDIFAIKSPRKYNTIKCQFTDVEYVVEIETAKDYEQLLIQKALLSGEELPLCREIIKYGNATS